jgi:hypothetical protein
LEHLWHHIILEADPLLDFRDISLYHRMTPPNQSPEPTAVARCICFSEAASRLWLSFLR